jgi:dihydroorotate dehydrogenase
MKTISQIAQENTMEYAEGMKEAFRMIEHEIDQCAINGYKFPILHIRDFIDKMLERKKNNELWKKKINKNKSTSYQRSD